MREDKKGKLVPYKLLQPGFEAIYTGEKITDSADNPNVLSDEDGNLFHKWSTFTWTFSGLERDWDSEVKYLNNMQLELGLLSDDIRQIRAHIASLVPCDSGFPVTVDELLYAIGREKLDTPSFHNGCWCPGMWWAQRTTQPSQMESMGIIYDVLLDYISGISRDDLISKYLYAKGFIKRIYSWLGSIKELDDVKKLMLKRILLTIEFFTKYSDTNPESIKENDLQKMEEEANDLFVEKSGKGFELDREISNLIGIPEIHPNWSPEYRENFETLNDPIKRELYQICCYISSGVYTLSDCHHNTFRFIENWIHGIGTGKLKILTRKTGAEKERKGELLFGYVFALDKWLLKVPMQFLLLDIGHIDIGFDIKNEILRVYSYLGEKRTPCKEWLVASLWYILTYNIIETDFPCGLIRHTNIITRAEQLGLNHREWMDLVLIK